MTTEQINAAWESYLKSMEKVSPKFVARMRKDRLARWAFDSGYCRGFVDGFDKAGDTANVRYLPPSKGIEC